MEALDYAARDNSHHAPVPPLSREHQRGVAIGHRLGAALLQNRACNVGFGLLPVVIQVVKLRRERTRGGQP